MGECFFKFSRLIIGLMAAIVFGATLLCGSCVSERKTENTSHSASGQVAADTVQYQVAQYKDFSPYLSGTEEAVDSTIFSARYPIFADEINNLVKNAIFVDGEQHVEQVSESFLAGFNEYAEEQIDEGNASINAWYKHQNCRVVLNEHGILTLQNAINDYTGGAHGMEVELWFNFDLQEKKLLQLTDIVADNAALLPIAERYFRQHENLADTASYGPSYFFEENNFTLAANFGLTKEGLLFHYNPYEIKSYAEGPTTFVIPYAELKDTLTSKGKKLVSEITAVN